MNIRSFAFVSILSIVASAGTPPASTPHPTSWLYPSPAALTAAIEAGFSGKEPNPKYTSAYFYPQKWVFGAHANAIPPLTCAFNMGLQANKDLENAPSLAKVEATCAGHLYVSDTYFVPSKVDANGHLIRPNQPSLPMAFNVGGTLLRPAKVDHDQHAIASSMQPFPFAAKEPAYKYTDHLTFEPNAPWNGNVNLVVVVGGKRRQLQIKNWDKDIVANATQHEAALSR